MPRKTCERCQRPISVCICEHLVSLTAPCDIVILQHPSEQKQPLATVPILQACISNVSVIVGEELSADAKIAKLLEKPEDIVVVFPADNADCWSLNQPVQSDFQFPKTLIVLDGTWRKAKLIWFKNQWLHGLKTVVLSDVPDSQYVIRSSSVDGGVSTLEAVMHSCNYLSSSENYMPLMKPFKAMIDWQIKKMGKEIFLAHYGSSDT